MIDAVNLMFPHQLVKNSQLLDNGNKVYLIEEHLFFNQYRFHKQKIAFHRASMKFYEDYLKNKKIEVAYIEAKNKNASISSLLKTLQSEGVKHIFILDPTDDWLSQRINEFEKVFKITIYENPLFLNTKDDLNSFFKADKKFHFQTKFYKSERKRRNILMDKDGEPDGGEWTYDKENRKKYPKGKTPTELKTPKESEYWDEAVDYTQTNFKDCPGELSTNRLYPVTHTEASQWFTDFLDHRFNEFGPYEDAIVQSENLLNHSLLSPLLNVGLLSIHEVVEQSLAYSSKNEVPLNSTEGFIRQIMGWREFIRGMYVAKGRKSRSSNFWNFKRKIPSSFYDGSTGISPVDDCIKKVLKNGYCHHIERLMVLGNFMLLCEFNPKDVYQWFMELFIDAYDWVMVPNVYGMSQFADGGTFATKPYISGSNYLKKMSDYPKGDWEKTWDGLFWHFIHKHEDFFKSNPRTSMMVNTWNKMSEEKTTEHLKNAKAFLEKLDQ